MKFLVVCICAMMAASNAGKMNKRRGIFGSPEADAMNNYAVEEIGFNDDVSNGGFDSGSQYNDDNSNNNHFGSSAHTDYHPSPLESTFNDDSYSARPQSNYNGAPAHTSGYVNFPPNDHNNQYDHQGSNGGYSQDYSNSASAGPSFNAAPMQNYLSPSQNVDRPHESVKTSHSESTERGRFPVQVPRTIVKTRTIEHAVPQPYEVVKHVAQPYPVQRVRAVVKEVPVPQVSYKYRDVVRQVPVERLIHKPVPVVKYVPVPIEHQVPVYIHQQQPVYEAPIVHHSAVAHQPIVSHAPLSASYGVPQSSYGLPQSYDAAHSYGSYGNSIGQPSFSQGW